MLIVLTSCSYFAHSVSTKSVSSRGVAVIFTRMRDVKSCELRTSDGCTKHGADPVAAVICAATGVLGVRARGTVA